jgi:hypothetical protein
MSSEMWKRFFSIFGGHGLCWVMPVISGGQVTAFCRMSRGNFSCQEKHKVETTSSAANTSANPVREACVASGIQGCHSFRPFLRAGRIASCRHMQRLRSIWGLRVLVFVLMTGLMPSIFGPNVRAEQPSSADAYSDWLREYLVNPSDPAVARALDAASSSKAPTFDGFLRVFIHSFEAQQPGLVPVEVFSVEAQSTDALVRMLYGQFQQVLGGVPATHATISATSSGLSGVTDRAPALLTDSGYDGAAPNRLSDSLSFASETAVVTPIRVYSTAFPQGP